MKRTRALSSLIVTVAALVIVCACVAGRTHTTGR